MATTIPALRVAQASLGIGVFSVVFGLVALGVKLGNLSAFNLIIGGAAIILAYLSASESARLHLPEKPHVVRNAALAIIAATLGIVLALFGCSQPTYTYPYPSAPKLKNIGLAMHTYHDKHGHLPPVAIYDKAGKPLLSWQVLLLPYLEEEELFKRFHLDESWDSPHNIQLLKEMPRIYARPPFDPGNDDYGTIYQVFVGPGSVFEDQKERTLDEIRKADGLGSTVLVIEAAAPVPWTKPQDIEYAPDKPLPALGRGTGKRKKSGGFEGMSQMVSTLFADGRVRNLPREPLDEKQLRAMITWNGGETVELP